MTKAEKDYLDMLGGWGCLICDGPAEIHHPRITVGMSQRAPHWLGIPLCSNHHRLGDFGQSIHNGQQAFEKNYMSEADMLAEIIQRLFQGMKKQC